jgi:serine/threonine-protein kinase
MVQEAAILENVGHPGVVRVYDCNVLPDCRPWLAMELVAGETLTARLERERAIAPCEVARLLVAVADVLAVVHARGVVHRDLKPDNLILTPGDRDFPLRVIDWGVARLGPIGRITVDGMTPGTPIYMSPEQACGHDIGAPCDVYALGVIAYEALSGQPPFDGRTLAEVISMRITGEPPALRECSTAPRSLCELVHRMIDNDLTKRPSALELRSRARAIADETSGDYASFELFRPRTRADADRLELGVTDAFPVISRPPWTPELTLSKRPADVARDNAIRATVRVRRR